MVDVEPQRLLCLFMLLLLLITIRMRMIPMIMMMRRIHIQWRIIVQAVLSLGGCQLHFLVFAS